MAGSEKSHIMSSTVTSTVAPSTQPLTRDALLAQANALKSQPIPYHELTCINDAFIKQLEGFQPGATVADMREVVSKRAHAAQQDQMMCEWAGCWGFGMGIVMLSAAAGGPIGVAVLGAGTLALSAVAFWGAHRDSKRIAEAVTFSKRLGEWSDMSSTRPPAASAARPSAVSSAPLPSQPPVEEASSATVP